MSATRFCFSYFFLVLVDLVESTVRWRQRLAVLELVVVGRIVFERGVDGGHLYLLILMLLLFVGTQTHGKYQAGCWRLSLLSAAAPDAERDKE